jgi:hypothetical protein
MLFYSVSHKALEKCDLVSVYEWFSKEVKQINNTI